MFQGGELSKKFTVTATLIVFKNKDTKTTCLREILIKGGPKSKKLTLF